MSENLTKRELAVLQKSGLALPMTLGKYNLFLHEIQKKDNQKRTFNVGVDAMNVYLHLTYSGMVQNTNQVWANTEYISKGLRITRDRVRSAKKLLSKLSLIHSTENKNEKTGLFEKKYTTVITITPLSTKEFIGADPTIDGQPSSVKRTMVQTPTSALSKKTSALSNNNALSNNALSVKDCLRLSETRETEKAYVIDKSENAVELKSPTLNTPLKNCCLGETSKLTGELTEIERESFSLLTSKYMDPSYMQNVNNVKKELDAFRILLNRVNSTNQGEIKKVVKKVIDLLEGRNTFWNKMLPLFTTFKGKLLERVMKEYCATRKKTVAELYKPQSGYVE